MDGTHVRRVTTPPETMPPPAPRFGEASVDRSAPGSVPSTLDTTRGTGVTGTADAPVGWRTYFKHKFDLQTENKDSFRVYTRRGGEEVDNASGGAPETSPANTKNRAPIKTLVLFAHGCGYTGLSWAVCVDALACRLGNETLLAAFDARGHGKSCGNAEQNYSGDSEKNKNDSVNFSAHRLARDVLDVTKELLRVCSVSSTGAGTGAGAGATSTSATRTRLSAGAYQNDARSNSRNNPTEPRRPVNVVFVGHSMGGAVAARAASLFESGGRENDSDITQETKSTVTSLRADPDQNQFVLAGVVVVDVVEGTAVASLPAAELAVSKIPKSFGTIKSAIEWSLKAGVTSNVTSAQVSTPSRLVLVETNPDKYYVWRTEIGATAKYWNGWFSGLSSVFLSNPKLPKLLVVAQTDRLDTELTIAQMTGLFQLVVVPNTGHAIHEDNPRAVAVAVDRFLKRFVGGK